MSHTPNYSIQLQKRTWKVKPGVCLRALWQVPSLVSVSANWSWESDIICPAWSQLLRTKPFPYWTVAETTTLTQSWNSDRRQDLPEKMSRQIQVSVKPCFTHEMKTTTCSHAKCMRSLERFNWIEPIIIFNLNCTWAGGIANTATFNLYITICTAIHLKESRPRALPAKFQLY